MGGRGWGRCDGDGGGGTQTNLRSSVVGVGYGVEAGAVAAVRRHRPHLRGGQVALAPVFSGGRDRLCVRGVLGRTVSYSIGRRRWRDVETEGAGVAGEEGAREGCKSTLTSAWLRRNGSNMLTINLNPNPNPYI